MTPVVARWADQRVQRLVGEILAMPPGGRAALGLRACLAAVNDGAVETLVVPGEGPVPGYECGRCGALSVDACSCPDWDTVPPPVPDVIEEMVAKTVKDGGQILVIRGVPSRIAARLYFPPACNCRAGTSVRRDDRDPVPVQRQGLYLPLVISIFLADSFCSALSPTEIVRMPSR